MIDKTTDGYSATTDDIEGMLRNLCAYALSDPDPLQRYVDLTHQQVLFDGVIAAIRRERGKALGDLAGMGVPLGKIAELINLDTPQQVKQLMTAAGVTVPTVRKSAASKGKPAAVSKPAASKAAASKPAAGKAAPEKEPEPARVLPPTVVPAGKRTLTPEERRALGLPEPTPVSRKPSMANR